MADAVSKRFSRKVTIVSFILTIFIMYIHANKLVFQNQVGTQGTLVNVLYKILAGTFGQVGVPFFSWFCGQSFFIYAAHNFPVEALSAVLVTVCTNMASVSLSYIVTPLIVLACLYVAARFLTRWLPKVYQLLCGGRIERPEP